MRQVIQCRYPLVFLALLTVMPIQSVCTSSSAADEPIADTTSTDITEHEIASYQSREALQPLSLEKAPPPSARLDGTPDVEELAKRIESHFDDNQSRRMHLQVDRPLYRPGETIWLRAWDLRTHDLVPDHDSVPGVSVLLLNPRGAVTDSKRFPIKGGLAAGDIEIPAGIMGGEYILRARTDDEIEVERPIVVAAYEPQQLNKELEFLRRAYGPGDEVEASFQVAAATGEPLANRSVKVIVAVDGDTLPAMRIATDERGTALVRFDLPDRIRRGDGLLTVLTEDGGISESISRSIPIVLQRIELRMFPEGGDLVHGLPSRVYFQAFDAHGEPADIEGHVVDDLGNMVARFESHHHGLGRFDLRPATGRTHYARITRPEGISERFVLPLPNEEGCVLRTFDDLDGMLTAVRASVRCTEPREVIVAATQRERLLDVARVEVPGRDVEAVVYLEPEDRSLAHSQGVARVTVFDSRSRPLAERIVYRNRRARLDIEVTPHQESYGPREQVTLEVRTKNVEGEPVPSDLSLSVVDDTLLRFADDKSGHLLSRVFLEPELPGEVREPNLYFDLTDERSAPAMELLMGARGWRRFEWMPIPATDPTKDAAGAYDDSRTAPGVGEEEPGRRTARHGSQDQDWWEHAELPVGFEAVPVPAGVEGSGGAGTTDPLAHGLSSTLEATSRRRKTVGDISAESGAGRAGVLGIGALGGRHRVDTASRDRHFSRGLKIKAISSGLLNKKQVERILRRHSMEIRYCYERELQREPNLRGQITLRALIDSRGRVSDVRILASNDRNETLQNCIRQRIGRWRFPEADRHSTVTIVFTLDPVRTADSERRPIVSVGSNDQEQLREFSVVREFPTPVYHGLDDSREDFRPTVFWSPSVRTDENGRARVSFFLSDAVTSFRVTTEGVGAAMAGRDETTFRSVLPIDVSARLPLAVTSGDLIELPVIASNRGDEAVELEVRLEAASGLRFQNEEPGPLIFSLPVEAGDRATRYVPMRAGDEAAEHEIRLTAEAGNHEDGLVRQVKVEQRGFPQSLSVSGRVSGKVRREIELKDAIPGTADLQVSIFPGTLSSLVAGVKGMLRMPRGCFEQTSSANHANVLVLRLLEAKGLSDPELVARSRRLLEGGYSRLTSFESPGHGFEWFGGEPASPVLSAYALMQLTEMKSVYDGVDADIIERTSKVILDSRDEEGGFRYKQGRGGAYARASDKVASAYITHALVRAGRRNGVGREIDLQRRVAASTGDPYVLALATTTMARSDGRTALVRQAAQRLSSMQADDGSWPGADHSITRSGRRDLLVETTSLAILALKESGGHEQSVLKGVEWIEGARRNGRWGATQATILALEALARHAESRARAPDSGEIRVLVNGSHVATESYIDSSTESIQANGFGRHLRTGSNVIDIESPRDIPLPYEIKLDYRSRDPASADDAPVILETSLAREMVRMGETVRLTTTITNPRSEGLPMTIARIRLPGGLESQAWQLAEHRERGVADYFETSPTEVVVYLRSLEPEETRTISLDLVAAVPGSYEGGASSAYPYYDEQEKFWAPPVSVRIERP